MTDELIRRTIIQRGGCRLCMAPDSECVPIFATAAADKEPLSSKIQACVNIKVHQADRLSARVCHACISYLNSWQSFKNRCYAAQKKQRGLLELWLAKERANKQKANLQQQQHQQQSSNSSMVGQRHHRQLELHQRNQHQQPPKILKQALSQPNHSSPLNQSELTIFPLNSSVDVSFIKEEPEDIIMEEETEEEMDPTQFLARDEDEEEEPNYTNNEGPPILTSLGLTHINSVNPFSFLSTELGNDASQTETQDDSLLYIPSQQNQVRRMQPPSQPACTICNMKFSNRANARRHERNIHGKNTSLTSNPADQSASASSTSTTLMPMKSAGTPQQSLLRRPVQTRNTINDIDYSKPEEYRDLLTDAKLHFIKRHLEFLEQYQDMRCNCCSKVYPTYKLFMAHMRKRYPTLSRNLCFKCLIQFDRKPLFIGHLKKRNCINLYRLYKADKTISKEPLPPIGRLGTKEVISNKVYGCRLCPKTFRLKVDFRGHVLEAHSEEQKSLTMGPSCGFCKMEFDDPLVRKRHYSNMECLNFLICGTCDEKFDTLPVYIEHVYAKHLQAPDSNNEDTDSPSSTQPALKYPQNCRVCGKLYNNYYNVLRHMESKHPDQLPGTYRCEKCDIGYPRQSELREHMFKIHGITLPKLKRDAYVCRMCGMGFEVIDAWMDHMATKYSRYYCGICEYQTENKSEFESHLEDHHKTKMFQCSECHHSFSSERSLETHILVVHKCKKDGPENGIENVEIKKEMPYEDEAAGMNGDTEEYGNEEENGDGNEVEDETFGNLRKRLKLDEISITRATDNTDHKVRQCPLCPETFMNGIALSNHMRSHNTPVTDKGESSAKSTMNTPVGTFGTVRSAMVNSRMRCRICQKRIHTKTSYKRHMLQEHQVRDCVFIRCTLCPAEFSNDKGLKVHMFRTHSITVQQMQEDESLRPVSKQESTEPGSVVGKKEKVMPKLIPKLMFECDICHTVYRNKDQLRAHKSIVHGTNENENQIEIEPEETPEPTLTVPEAWWQCRYCDENFNASKKLTIHMNSHEEHDTTDNTCKDCGNVYRTRKSLWVHRHKKHPRLPNPSTCELCNKVFFDKTELFHHLKTHSNADVFTHLQEMHQQLEVEQGSIQQKQQKQEADDDSAPAAMEVPPPQIEDLSCHLCGQKFQNKRVLSKHLRLHEEADAFSNSPLAAMLADTTISIEENGSNEYAYPTYKGQMVDGEYACDMCPKTFPLITALKVHRGWHFRSPDGRQVTDPANMWQPDSIPQSKQKRMRPSNNPPVCPYCNSTFASGNNLRRHIVEVHKRNEAKIMRENGSVNENVFVEKEMECQACGITFNTRWDWINHKIGHARTMKPSTTFEWGCEICGKIFTRKERLLAHMTHHLNGKYDDDSSQSAEQNSEMGGGENSRSSLSSQSHSQQSHNSSSRQNNHQQLPQHHQQREQQKQQEPQQKEHNQQVKEEENEDNEDNEENEENDNEHEEKEEETHHEEDEETRNQPQQQQMNGGQHEVEYEEEVEAEEEPDDDEDEDGGEEMEEEEEDEEEEEEEDEPVDHKTSSVVRHEAAYSCDLCQVFFNTAKELRRHVTSHIINTPEITITKTHDRYQSHGEQQSQQEEEEEEQQQQQQQQQQEEEQQLDITGDQGAEDDEEDDDEEEDEVDGEEVEDEDDDGEEEDDEDEYEEKYQIQSQQLPDGRIEGFKCRLCGTNNENRLDMIQCMESHKMPNNLRCGECHLFFVDNKRVHAHEQLCHPN